MVPALPIGKLLTEAGLISEGQLQTALYDQQIYADMRLGDILVSRGWLKQETIDFFVENLQRARLSRLRIRLGDCFVKAALIDEAQVESILAEQDLNHVRFGSVAVLKGYISQKTLDFFLKYVFPQSSKIKQSFWQSTNGHLGHEPTFDHLYEVQKVQPKALNRQYQPTTPKSATQGVRANSLQSRNDIEDIHWMG